MNTKLTVTKFLAILLLCITCAESISKPAHIFLLAGQSNMAGIGGVLPDWSKWDGVVPPESQPTPAILRLNPKLHWEVAKEPLHVGIDVNLTGVNGVGPGLPFANCLFSKTPGYGIIGLVPCAISGTKIIQWQRGTQYYNDLVRRAMAARKNGGTIEALLWYQGESDTMSDDDAHGYEARLKQFIVDLRNDLDSPSLLVIQVALASGGRHIEMVRKVQLHTDLPNVTCVDAMGLPLQQDHLHLSTPAQVRLGHMLCDAYISTLYV